MMGIFPTKNLEIIVKYYDLAIKITLEFWNNQSSKTRILVFHSQNRALKVLKG